jgi:hypothetical protein
MMAFLCLCFICKAQVKDTLNSQNWFYSQSQNEMTGKFSYFAKLLNEPSDNKMNVVLMVRNQEGKNNVMLVIGGGLFNISGDYYQIQLKFDDGSIDSYWTDVAADNQFNLVFMRNPNNIIKKMKQAKHIFMSAYIYGKGENVFRFEVQNLVWEH